MKPTVISSGNSGTAPKGSSTSANGMNIPVNHDYAAPTSHHTQFADAGTSFGSPGSTARQQQAHHPQQHFQPGFGFDNDMDMDMDMFPRSRIGRMHHDPFSGFGGSHFGFPEFGSMGRRRTDDDFFNRLPSEFRQYIPETFAHRRAGGGSGGSNTGSSAGGQQSPQYYQNYSPNGIGVQQPHSQQHGYPSQQHPQYAQPQQQQQPPASPSKTVCDAAIQTEDSSSRRSADEVDHAAAPSMHATDNNLNQHGLRNTVDMGVKTAAENEAHGARSQSAPPQEQLQQQQQRPAAAQGEANVHKSYYAPQQQPHPQQKQQTPPPPQTPGGSYIRTIPIFVEGRSEPIINSHKEIPNQNQSSASATSTSESGPDVIFTARLPPSKGHTTPRQSQQAQPQQPHYQQHAAAHPHPQQQQKHPQHRPTPLNTHMQPDQQQQQPQQQQQNAGGAGHPPQTPHTLDSINKIQDIQRDVLELMTAVENFKGMRGDKEYAYLDEMLTRNLLKLDNIDTNGKDSIRLARKEAIKCIEASINVLEAKAEENARRAKGGAESGTAASNEGDKDAPSSEKQPRRSTSKDDATQETKATEAGGVESSQAASEQQPIPLPPPAGMQAETSTESQNEQNTNLPKEEVTTEEVSAKATEAVSVKETK